MPHGDEMHEAGLDAVGPVRAPRHAPVQEHRARQPTVGESRPSVRRPAPEAAPPAGDPGAEGDQRDAARGRQLAQQPLELIAPQRSGPGGRAAAEAVAADLPRGEPTAAVRRLPGQRPRVAQALADPLIEVQRLRRDTARADHRAAAVAAAPLPKSPNAGESRHAGR